MPRALLRISEPQKDLIINLGVWIGIAAYFVVMHLIVWQLAAWWIIEGILLFGGLFVWMYKDELRGWRYGAVSPIVTDSEDESAPKDGGVA